MQIESTSMLTALYCVKMIQAEIHLLGQTLKLQLHEIFFYFFFYYLCLPIEQNA